MRPYGVVTAKNTITPPTVEKNFMGSLRFGLAGTREIVIVRLSDLYEYMTKLSTPDSKGICMKQAKSFFISMSKEQLTDYHNNAQYPIWQVTMAPHEALYMPPGSYFIERIVGHPNYVGFRVGVLDGDLQTVSNLSKIHENLAKEHKLLKTLLEQMQLDNSPKVTWNANPDLIVIGVGETGNDCALN
eukprot:8997427-Pyramimonas_sp.AAC.1